MADFDNSFYDVLTKQLYFKDNENRLKWKDAYNSANDLYYGSTDTTFLFSAQHKKYIILATVLTALNNSETIIWQNTPGKNMTAELSLKNNDLLILLFSRTDKNTNQRYLDELLRIFTEWPKIKSVIYKYYELLEEQYLCLFEFNDYQLTQYVRLSIKNNNTQKFDSINSGASKTQIIKKYKPNPQFDAPNLKYKCFIITTKSNSKNPYKSHILEPNNKIYSTMKDEIISAIQEERKETSADEEAAIETETTNAENKVVDEEAAAREEETTKAERDAKAQQKKAREAAYAKSLAFSAELKQHVKNTTEATQLKKQQITADENLKTDRLNKTWRIFKPFKGFRGRWFGDTRKDLWGENRSKATGGRINKTRRRKLKKHTQKNKRRKNNRK